MKRRQFLAVSGAAGLAGVAGLSGTGCGSSGPGSGARTWQSARGLVEVSGELVSRYMHERLGWTISRPASGHPRAIVYCLHAKGGNHRMAFDAIRVPRSEERRVGKECRSRWSPYH